MRSPSDDDHATPAAGPEQRVCEPAGERHQGGMPNAGGNQRLSGRGVGNATTRLRARRTTPETARAGEQMPKFRKKPVVIEAMLFDGTEPSARTVLDWMAQHRPAQVDASPSYRPGIRSIFITTLEGVMEASAGDWVIRGISGEFYPCKPDIFAATYDPA